MLESCRDAGGGRTVVLRGEAGIGKTRLVEEIERAARDAGFACHGGLVLDFGAATGRDAIQSLVRGLLELGEPGHADAASSAIERARADGLIDAGATLFFDDLLDQPMTFADRTVYEAMDNAMRVRGRLNAMKRLVRRASRRRPRLLSVEDIHWSDGSTLRQLAALSATVTRCPARLLLNARTLSDALDDAQYTLVDLAPLSASEAKAMAESFPGADAALAGRCIARAAGNPLFLEQLLNDAKDSAGSRTGTQRTDRCAAGQGESGR